MLFTLGHVYKNISKFWSNITILLISREEWKIIINVESIVIIIELKVILMFLLLLLEEGPEVADEEPAAVILLTTVDDSNGTVLVPLALWRRNDLVIDSWIKCTNDCFCAVSLGLSDEGGWKLCGFNTILSLNFSSFIELVYELVFLEEIDHADCPLPTLAFGWRKVLSYKS